MNSVGEGKVEIFIFTICQQKGLTSAICIVGLGENNFDCNFSKLEVGIPCHINASFLVVKAM
jgi:hypothetical protein